MLTNSLAPTRRSVNSFRGRYGRLAKYGITAIPSLLFRFQGELGLSFAEVGFISHILSYKWDVRDPYPSLREVAKRTGYSLRALKKMKAQLVRKGLLKVRERFDERGRRLSDGYDFSPLFSRLEEAIDSTRDSEDRSIDRIKGRGIPLTDQSDLYPGEKGFTGEGERKFTPGMKECSPPIDGDKTDLKGYPIDSPFGEEETYKKNEEKEEQREGRSSGNSVRAVCPACNREVQAEAIMENGLCAACSILGVT